MIATYVSGIDNEKNIIKAIHDVAYCGLNENLKKFVKEIFPDVTNQDVLKANSLGGIYKRDLEIILHGKSVRNQCQKRSWKQCTSRKSGRFYSFFKYY